MLGKFLAVFSLLCVCLLTIAATPTPKPKKVNPDCSYNGMGGLYLTKSATNISEVVTLKIHNPDNNRAQTAYIELDYTNRLTSTSDASAFSNGYNTISGAVGQVLLEKDVNVPKMCRGFHYLVYRYRLIYAIGSPCYGQASEYTYMTYDAAHGSCPSDPGPIE